MRAIKLSTKCNLSVMETLSVYLHHENNSISVTEMKGASALDEKMENFKMIPQTEWVVKSTNFLQQ